MQKSETLNFTSICEWKDCHRRIECGGSETIAPALAIQSTHVLGACDGVLRVVRNCGESGENAEAGSRKSYEAGRDFSLVRLSD